MLHSGWCFVILRVLVKLYNHYDTKKQVLPCMDIGVLYIKSHDPHTM